MKRINLVFIAMAAMVLTSCGSQNAIQPPVAGKEAQVLESNGNLRTDDYYWMRLNDEQKNAVVPDSQTTKVLAYLNAENNYARSVMKHTEPLQQTLFEELKGRMKQNDESVPYLDNGYFYFNRYFEGKEYPVFYRRGESENAVQEILLDVNALAKNHNYISVGSMAVSQSNTLLAYSVDYVSRRQYTVMFKDIVTGNLLTDSVTNTEGPVVWANDNKTLFYITKDVETLRAAKVMKHILGTDQSLDKLVFNEADEEFSVSLGRTQSRKYITINSHQTLSSETRILDASNPNGGFTIFEPRKQNHEYHIDHLNGEFYIMTNADSASNFKLMKMAEGERGMKNWTDLIPHRKDVLLQDFRIFDNHLVLNERSNGLTNIRIIDMTSDKEHYIDFGEETYTAWIGNNPNANSTTLRFGYSSLTTPGSVIDYEMNTKTSKLLKQDSVLGGFNKNNYESKRIWVKAKDGTIVPVSLVYRKGFVKNGKAPLLLYAYGSYGSSTEPGFRSNIISLLDRGIVFAIAHVRGGSEMGRHWYEDGKLLHKINTFTDFNDCARYLIAEKYTSAEHLYANGGSAGGLLMGAIANMEPQLYNGIVAQVPFVDVVTTMLDETIPLTTFEWDEWGDPRQQIFYDYMLSYSPYDQVKEQDYPNMLVTTGYWDSQVQYWEPAKWVAKLRDMKTDDNILVMDVNMTAGHGGASGRFERLKTVALQYAFILNLEGIRD